MLLKKYKLRIHHVPITVRSHVQPWASQSTIVENIISASSSSSSLPPQSCIIIFVSTIMIIIIIIIIITIIIKIMITRNTVMMRIVGVKMLLSRKSKMFFVKRLQLILY